MALTTHLFLAPKLESICVRLFLLWAFMACSGVNFINFKVCSNSWSVYRACEVLCKHSNFCLCGSNSLLLGNILTGVFIF